MKSEELGDGQAGGIESSGERKFDDASGLARAARKCSSRPGYSTTAFVLLTKYLTVQIIQIYDFDTGCHYIHSI